MYAGRDRGLIIAETLKEFISNKFVCEIGCNDGEILYELSKYSKKAIGIEVTKEPYDEAKQLEYKCDTAIVHSDAYSFLKENTHINPDLFYFWANYRKKKSGMQWWVERILELRGKTNPVIVAYIDVSGLQLGAAREIQEIYGGDIIFLSYGVSSIKFGLLIIQSNGQVVNTSRASPSISRSEYDDTVTDEYEQWIKKLSIIDYKDV